MGVWLGPMGKVKPLAIYTAGDKEEIFTATAYSWLPPGSTDVVGGAPTVSYEDDYVSVSVPSKQEYDGSVYYVNQSGLVSCGPFDLTKYKTLSLTYINDGAYQPDVDNDSARLYVSTSGDSYNADRDTWVTIRPNTDHIVLDVSNVTGTLYIGLVLFAAGGRQNLTGLQITGITATA